MFCCERGERRSRHLSRINNASIAVCDRRPGELTAANQTGHARNPPNVTTSFPSPVFPTTTLLPTWEGPLTLRLKYNYFLLKPSLEDIPGLPI